MTLKVRSDSSSRAVRRDVELQVEVYEAAGSPNGPAEDDDNVTRWFMDRMEKSTPCALPRSYCVWIRIGAGSGGPH